MDAYLGHRMCGRFVITSPPQALRQIFGYAEQPNFPPRHNIAPTQPVPVILMEHGTKHFRLMRWGLVPSWVKDPRKITLLINARAESVVDKPAFKNAIRRRRCLVPADGYYEWQATKDGKRPFFVHRRDGRPFGLAGLAESWTGPNGEELDTVAIVTAPASADLAVLHHRVPVSLMPRDFERWLDCREDDAMPVLHLLTGPEVGEFTWHEVSRRVNSASNDDAPLLLPVPAEERAAKQAPKPAKRMAANRPMPPKSDDGQGSLF